MSSPQSHCDAWNSSASSDLGALCSSLASSDAEQVTDDTSQDDEGSPDWECVLEDVAGQLRASGDFAEAGELVQQCVGAAPQRLSGLLRQTSATILTPFHTPPAKRQ